MLYLVGLGLARLDDISVRGLQIIRACRAVYLENYTSILGCSTAEMEAFYGCKVIVADREDIESRLDAILEQAVNEDVAVLVVGDPFGATTHMDLVLRAKARNIKVEVVHNASIMNGIGECAFNRCCNVIMGDPYPS